MIFFRSKSLSQLVKMKTSSLRSYVHNVAKLGFNSNNKLYDKVRPSYPDVVIDEAFKRISSSISSNTKSGLSVIDLAAGTGKLTRKLVERKEIDRLVAVEPVQGMRDYFQKSLCDRVSCLEGSSTDLSVLGTERFDAIFVGQAFHWFANVESIREIHNYLKPGSISSVFFTSVLQDCSIISIKLQYIDLFTLYRWSINSHMEFGKPQI